MLRVTKNTGADGETLKRYEISDWVAGVEKRKNKAGFDPAKNAWEANFASIDVTGGSASVKIELSRDGKLVYTDYLSLLKFLLWNLLHLHFLSRLELV